jgi:acetyl-CoA carboxylase carboxyltransferase component
MAVSSPRLVSMALGEKVSAADLGGWRLHAEITGLTDQVVDKEEEVFDSIASISRTCRAITTSAT